MRVTASDGDGTSNGDHGRGLDCTGMIQRFYTCLALEATAYKHSQSHCQMGLAGVLYAGATGQDKDSGGQRMRRDRNR
jgi:hypothetical protein